MHPLVKEVGQNETDNKQADRSTDNPFDDACIESLRAATRECDGDTDHEDKRREYEVRNGKADPIRVRQYGIDGKSPKSGAHH